MFNHYYIQFVPISGFNGDNMIERSKNMPWYNCPTLLVAFDNVHEPFHSVEEPLRLPLQGVYKILGIGTVPVWRVETGDLKPRMMNPFAPCGVESECKSVKMHNEALSEAESGDNVCFNVRSVTVKDIRRGYVASDGKNEAATICENFTAQTIITHTWADREGLHAVLVATRRTLRTSSTSCSRTLTGGQAMSLTQILSESRTAILLLSSSSRQSRCGVRHSWSTYSFRFIVSDMLQTVGVVKVVTPKQTAAASNKLIT